MSHCQPFQSSLQDASSLLSAGTSVIHSDGEHLAVEESRQQKH